MWVGCKVAWCKIPPISTTVIMENYTYQTVSPLPSKEGQLVVKSLRSNYQVIARLGSGSFGTVVLARYRHAKSQLLKANGTTANTLMSPLTEAYSHLDGLVAMKTMNKRLPSLGDYLKVKEVQFINAIPSHPSLVQVYELFVDDTNCQLHIVMEPMNSNLYQLIKLRRRQQFLNTTLCSILTQLVDGLRHIHRHDYFHRDVKPENILVVPTLLYYGDRNAVPPHRKKDNYIVKIADYGLARRVNDTRPYTAYVSTRWYRSPEILLRQKRYSQPADIWAFGAVAAEIANFYPLFPGTNEIDQTWRIVKILGSPFVPADLPVDSYLVPLGGYWDEATTLSARLGLSLPYSQGNDISEVLPNPEHAELARVVQRCLAWDPAARIDVDGVCSMPYFRNTSVAQSVPEKYNDMSSPLVEYTDVNYGPVGQLFPEMEECDDMHRRYEFDDFLKVPPEELDDETIPDDSDFTAASLQDGEWEAPMPEIRNV